MIKYDSQTFFKGMLINDSSISFDITEEVISLGTFLGSNFEIMKKIYKSMRSFEHQFLYKPMIGAELSISFNYEKQDVVVCRQSTEITFSRDSFLQFLGKIDATFAPIYPIGTTIEIDIELLPEEVQTIFKDSEVGALINISGRKLPLISGFEGYIVDYFGRLWPFGEFPGSNPILISNMMIKRVVLEGYSDEYEEQFAFDVLRATQAANQQISTAFMTVEDSLAYYEAVTSIEE